jgi:hypothetical protein
MTGNHWATETSLKHAVSKKTGTTDGSVRDQSANSADKRRSTQSAGFDPAAVGRGTATGVIRPSAASKAQF